MLKRQHSPGNCQGISLPLDYLGPLGQPFQLHAQYGMHAAVTGVTVDAGEVTVLVQVSAKLERRLPIVVADVIVTEYGIAQIKTFSQQTGINGCSDMCDFINCREQALTKSNLHVKLWSAYRSLALSYEGVFWCVHTLGCCHEYSPDWLCGI